MKRHAVTIITVCAICLMATTSFAKGRTPDYLYVPQVLKSKQNKVLDPDALVFSGGGASGVAYAGVLNYLHKEEKLENVKSYMGASAGAIFSMLFYIGMKPDEVNKLYTEIDWKSFIECRAPINLLKLMRNYTKRDLLIQLPFFVGNYLESWGISSGYNITKTMEKVLVKRELTPNGQVTFKQLKERLAQKDPNHVQKDLYVVAFSTSYYKTCILSADTTPDMDVVTAIRASMSIPLVFDPVEVKIEGKKDYLVDGGTTYNYPIEYLANKKTTPLGFVLGNQEQYLKPQYDPPSTFFDFLKHIFWGLFDNIGPRIEDNAYRTIFIDTPTVGMLDFDMTPEDRKAAIDAGYAATAKYFE